MALKVAISTWAVLFCKIAHKNSGARAGVTTTLSFETGDDV